MNNKSKSQAMLISILIIATAALAIGLAVATVGSTETKIALVSKDSLPASSLAKNCLDNALMKMARNDLDVTSNFTVGEGKCTIELTGNNPYSVTSTGQVGRSWRRIKSTVNIVNEVLEIKSWQEDYQ